MKCTLDRGLLVDTLSVVRIAEKPEGLFRAAGESVDLSARDLNINIKTGTPAKVEGEASFVVDFKRLAAIVAASSAKTVDFELGEGPLRVTLGKSRYRLPVMDAAAFPVDTTEVPMHELKDPFAFSELIIRTAPMCDKADRVTQGMLIKGDKVRGIVMVATDCRRLIEFCHPGDGPEFPVVVPQKTALAIAKIIDKAEAGTNVSIGSNDRMVYVNVGGVRISGYTREGDFVDYAPIIDKDRFADPAAVVTAPAGDLLQIFKRAELANPDAPQVRFIGHGDAMVLRVGNDSEPDFDEPVEIQNTVATGTIAILRPFDFVYNIWHFTEVMGKLHEGAMVELVLTSESSPARLTTPAEPGLTFVSMPFPPRVVPLPESAAVQ